MKTNYLGQKPAVASVVEMLIGWLIAGKNATHRIPVMLELLAILYLSLGAAKAQTNCYYGLLHTALGNATLQTNPTSSALIVSGIGSSGNDGVQIATGGSGGGATLNLGVYNPAVLPADASLSVVYLGRNDGRVQQIDLKSDAAGGASIFADFTGLGAPTVSVALYSNDTLVASASGIPPTTALATFTTAGTPHGNGLPLIINPCILNPGACYGDVDLILSIPDPTGPNGSIITIHGQGPMFCTRMQISPGYPVPYFMPKYQVKATTITGHNLGSVYVQQEGYVYIENAGFSPGSFEHHAVGQAQYDFSTPGALALTNIGPSGSDGVDVELRNANTFGLDMVALNPQPLPPVQSPMLLSITATGRLAGAATEQALGTLSFVNQETNIGLSADLSSLGAAMVHVELWQGCALVASYDTANGGIVLTSTQGATGVSVGYEPGDDPCGTTSPLPPWWWWVKWAGPMQLATPSGPAVADHVRVAVEGSFPALVALTHVTSKMTQNAGTFLHELGHNFGVNHGGNQHFPLGQSALVQTASGSLIVSNTAAGGSPGVEIALVRANCCEVAAPTLQPGQGAHFEVHGWADGIENRIGSTMDLTANPAGETQFAADMSPLGTTHYTIAAFDGGVRVAGVSNQPAGVFSVLSNTVALVSLRSDVLHSKSYVRIRLPKVPGDPGPVIRLPPALVVNGDEVIILAEDVVRYVGPQNRILITASGMDSFQLASEKPGYFGNGHTALGTALLSADGGVVGVGHIGSSGNNGVSIDLNNAQNALVSFAPFDFSSVQAPGSPVPWFQAHVFGQLGSQPNQELGSLEFTDTAAGGVQVNPNFMSSASLHKRFAVFAHGQLIQSGTNDSGATVYGWPIGLGAQTCASTAVAGFTVLFGQLVQISVDGGSSVQGDELRVFPENTSQPVGALQSFNLVARAFDSFAIVGETLTPGLNPAITGSSPAQSSGVVLTVPTSFGYDYTIDAVDAFGLPHPWPWTPASAFFGDGTVQSITLPANKPHQFFRLRAAGPGM